MPMAALSLDPQQTAVIVIECQNDLVHESRAEERGIGGALSRAVKARGVIDRIARVLDAARGSGAAVFYATIENRPDVPKPRCAIYRWSSGTPLLQQGTWGARVHDAIAPRDGDQVINRLVSIDPSYGSGLFEVLRARGCQTLVLMGVSTNFAVEGTVRAAVNRMFDVVVVADGCASVPDAFHEFTVQNILPLLSTVTTSDAVVTALGAIT